MNSKTKVMIVDDNKEFVKLLSMFINSQTDMEVVAKDWWICGSLCSTNDILIRKYHKGLSEGDLISFENIGAYSVTEGINLFLSRTLPCVLLRKKKYDYEVQREYVESYILNMPGGRKNG